MFSPTFEIPPALLFGTQVVVSDALPIDPSPGEVGRRIVRHGMAEILAWLGEDVGPKPEDQTHALLIGGTLHTSREYLDRLTSSMTSPKTPTEPAETTGPLDHHPTGDPTA